jgi:hypothetical protein
VVDRARLAGARIGFDGPTPYVNTIPAAQEPERPGDPELERRLRSLIRWNAMAVVLRANRDSSAGAATWCDCRASSHGRRTSSNVCSKRSRSCATSWHVVPAAAPRHRTIDQESKADALKHLDD